MPRERPTAGKPPCPRCGQPGRSVRRITLEHLLRPGLRPRIGDAPWYVCETPDCRVAYFQPAGRVFETSDLTVPFGIKAPDPPRPVCYCFDHTIEEIEDEIAHTGSSSVPQQIRAAMKSEGCRCERTNPLGRCCLATVQTVIDRALQRQETVGPQDSTAEPACDCCCGPGSDESLDATVARRAGLLATGGSLVAAVLSSACCWLPLAAIGLGFSAAGVAGFFERWRIPLILVAGLLLSVGFWFAYGPPARASACCSPRALRARRGMLWVSTLLVVIAVAFPQWLVAATGNAPSNSATSARLAGPLVRVELPVRGMTCAGCAAILERRLSKLPAVTQVEVSYPDRRVRIVARGDQTVSLRAEAVAAIRAAGYEVPEPATRP